MKSKMILMRGMLFLILQEPKNLLPKRWNYSGKVMWLKCFLWQDTSISKLDEMLESTFDITEWRMEVERVLPALKFFTRPDNKVMNNKLITFGTECCSSCIWISENGLVNGLIFFPENFYCLRVDNWLLIALWPMINWCEQHQYHSSIINHSKVGISVQKYWQSTRPFLLIHM